MLYSAPMILDDGLPVMIEYDADGRYLVCLVCRRAVGAHTPEERATCVSRATEDT